MEIFLQDLDDATTATRHLQYRYCDTELGSYPFEQSGPVLLVEQSGTWRCFVSNTIDHSIDHLMDRLFAR